MRLTCVASPRPSALAPAGAHACASPSSASEHRLDRSTSFGGGWRNDGQVHLPSMVSSPVPGTSTLKVAVFLERLAAIPVVRTGQARRPCLLLAFDATASREAT